MSTQVFALLEFALRLIEANLSRERDLDRLKWVADLEAFIEDTENYTFDRNRLVLYPTPSNSVREMTLVELRELQADARKLLWAAALSRTPAKEQEKFVFPLSDVSTTHPFHFEGEVRVLPSQLRTYPLEDNPKEVFEIAIYAKPKPAFLMALVLVLSQTEKLPIGICPEDQKLFYRVRRQLYCSRKCVLRANKRAFLARQEEAKNKRRRRK